MGRIYITRHGETLWNKEKRMQGQLDSDLSGLGIKQAQWLKERVQTYSIDAVYSSPLERAYKTAVIVSESWGCNIVQDNRLAEIHLGHWQGKMMADIIAMDKENYDYFWNRPDLYKNETGESFIEVCNRVKEFYEEIKLKHKNDVIFLFAHAAVIQSLLCTVFRDNDLANLWNHKHMHPGSLTIIDFDDDQETLTMTADISHYKESLSENGWFEAINKNKNAK